MADTDGTRLCDVRLYNIIVVGLGFMLLFTTFQAGSMVEKSALDHAKKESNGTFTGDGYISLSIIYAVFAVSTWIAPIVVNLIGPKITMFIASIFYFLFILSFLKPMTWALYLGSVLVGLGAALISTAQGHLFTINSDSTTLSRNSGIFWGMFQCSLLFGNLYSYVVLRGNTDISESSRTKLFGGLSGVAFIGVLTFLFLRKTPGNNLESYTEDEAEDTQRNFRPLETLKMSYQLLRSREMMIFSVVALYAVTGIGCIIIKGTMLQSETRRGFLALVIILVFVVVGVELTFFSGVYGTCIAKNKHFGSEAKGLIGLSGMLIGTGEIIGACLFGVLWKKMNKLGRDPVIMLGYLLHVVCFFLIFLNFPVKSPIQETDDTTYIKSSKEIAMFCSFLLGLGDSCLNTQILSVLAALFPMNSSSAFAMFGFVRSIASSAAFYYSGQLLLPWQLLILVIMGTIGTYCFIHLEFYYTHRRYNGYQMI